MCRYGDDIRCHMVRSCIFERFFLKKHNICGCGSLKFVVVAEKI